MLIRLSARLEEDDAGNAGMVVRLFLFFMVSSPSGSVLMPNSPCQAGALCGTSSLPSTCIRILSLLSDASTSLSSATMDLRETSGGATNANRPPPGRVCSSLGCTARVGVVSTPGVMGEWSSAGCRS